MHLVKQPFHWLEVRKKQNKYVAQVPTIIRLLTHKGEDIITYFDKFGES